MKRKLLCALIAGMGAAGVAQAQVSGNVVKIGVLNDMSGLYADIGGPGSVVAAKMAVEDYLKATKSSLKVEVVSADHQNKPDVGSSIARKWYDTDGVDVIVDVPTSSVALAINQVTREKGKAFINTGAATSDLTGKDCSPNTVHWLYDTWMLAHGTGSAVVKAGGNSWFFLTADYAFGHALEADTSAVIKAKGGSIVGAVKHPLNASDFSSFLLQAQNSKAQVLALAHAGGDFINSVKSAKEFGITKNMKMAGLLVFVTDIHSLGLKNTEGLLLTTSWDWNLNDQTRAFGKKFFEKTKRMPTDIQAADYSATMTYLKAVQAAKTVDADKVMAQIKKTPINDFYAKGVVRPDGRMVHDMYLMQVKSPAESTKPWDYYKLVATLPGDQVYTSKADSKCALWK